MKTWRDRHEAWEGRELRKAVRYGPTRGKRLNITELARVLGLDRATLYRLAHKHGVSLTKKDGEDEQMSEAKG